MDELVEVKETLGTFLNGLENDYLEMAIRDDKTFAQEVHFAMQLLSKNEFLLKTAKKNKQSLKNAILNISATGLTLNPISKYAYLIPRKGEVCLDISYLGMIKAATDSGSIVYAHADVVREHDKFILKGIGEKPEHNFQPFGERGKVIGAFVTVRTLEKEYLTTVMSIEELNDIRNKSEAFKKGFGPWVDFESEMQKKTVIKRGAKMWPRTDKFHILEKTIAVANEQEGIDFESEYEADRKLLENDFPRKAEDMVSGPDYLITKGKFKNKRLREVDEFELEEYICFMDKGIANNKYRSSDWLETHEKMKDYLDNYKTYQEIEAENDETGQN